MKQIIEMLENDIIKTYKIRYDDKKLKELKEKIKKYSIVRELEIRYDCISDDAESYVTTHPYIDFDEFMGVIEEDKLENKTEEKCENDSNMLINYCNLPKFGGPSYVTKKVRLKKYPYLFNILFRKHKNNEKNMFEKLFLYINNDIVLDFYMNKIQILGIKPVTKLVYDENIPIQEKISLIEELFDSMIITLEKEESLLDIKSQIKMVSKNNVKDKRYKTKLLEAMKERIKIAKENKKMIDSINDYIIKNKSCGYNEYPKILFL